MKEIQSSVVKQAIAPVAIKDNAAFVSQGIDTADADYAEFHLNIGVTDIAFAALKVVESDVLTNPTTLDTPTDVLDVTTKPGATDDGSIWIVGVNLKKLRKRYIQLQATAGDGTAGTFASATCVLKKSGAIGSSAADRGVGYVEYV